MNSVPSDCQCVLLALWLLFLWFLVPVSVSSTRSSPIPTLIESLYIRQVPLWAFPWWTASTSFFKKSREWVRQMESEKLPQNLSHWDNSTSQVMWSETPLHVKHSEWCQTQKWNRERTSVGGIRPLGMQAMMVNRQSSNTARGSWSLNIPTSMLQWLHWG